MESKACSSCARARRRCGRQRPDCARCRTRGISCHYPPSKPPRFIPLVDDAPGTVAVKRPSFELLIPSLAVPPSLENGWFASPESWTIDAPPSDLVLATTNRISSVDLDRLLKTVLGWLVQWVEEGSNPFIYRELYRHRFPQCIQDAYLSLSSYLHSTASNKQMIFRIIEHRVLQLVAQGVPSQGLASGGGSDDTATFDALEHLARVQSLLVYQCIGLYDGNIRLRHLAEQHIPVLESWLFQLVSQASQTTCSGESLISAPSEQIAAPTSIPCDNLLWYSWILAESTRRTWLITSGIQGLYKLIRDGTASCMGGTIFTSRRGFWEAPSALAWEKQCCELYTGLVRLTEVDKMFAMVPRAEINDFAKVILECTFGLEQTERWGV
ncbi:uncharacterized protein K460DRAFT_288156 [Cucurbitaria berberidis CBS 394.84]|uniref:Zn(2)-C6 fungal-type domain-containing protein n=1 Tax=Cucurbitaria berberidis CBS 394.84 TaxID=1168544 RepID=A0A9P4GF55_9PLEO|nr:uncharacterized protein K460DRAFT_288156 [Cucurbitaria berberidis CBS 394.84]KAF1844425.1 hypothetical protein K460DRAFT_288156 [Cucurbitaria berberidis CBS 394.84]